jgi:hypothetical protein
MGFPEGSGVEFRVLSYSSQSEYRMNKQQQQQSSVYKNPGMRRVVCINRNFGRVICIIAVNNKCNSVLFKGILYR